MDFSEAEDTRRIPSVGSKTSQGCSGAGPAHILELIRFRGQSMVLAPGPFVWGQRPAVARIKRIIRVIGADVLDHEINGEPSLLSK